MNSNNPLVSVIIPVYNGAKYLSQALESVVDQTYSPIEIVVVDDGSTDESVSIAESFKNIHIIKQRNKGAAAARNRGLQSCRGEFISFLDADDYWVVYKTQRQVSYILNHPKIHCVVGRFQNFFEPGADIPSGINKNDFLDEKLGKMPTLGTLLVRRSVFDKVGLFNPKLRIENDFDWLVRIRDAGITIPFMDEILMFRRLHGNNISYRINKINFLTIFRESMRRKENQKSNRKK